MTFYADPHRCPDCRAALPALAATCPACRLTLRGETAQRLYDALRTADALLRVLRAESVAEPVPAPVATAPVPVHLPPPIPGPRSSPSRGLSAASVPRILLSLGAACLLVAALVFLAVTWSVMGVGGRTATLVGFTVVAGGLAGWMARRGLRGAAEALGLVGLGLLSLDLVGARHAGWLGGIGSPGFLVLLGAMLAATGAAASVAVRRTPVRRITGAQLVSAVGTGLMAVGLADADGSAALPVRLVVAVLLAAGCALAAHRLGLEVAAVGHAVVAGLAWTALAGHGLVRALDHDSVNGLWLHLEGWPVLAAVGLAALLGLVRGLPMTTRVAGCAIAVALLAVLVALPAHESRTELTLVVLALLLLVGAGSWFAPAPWRPVGALWLVLGGCWCVGVAGSLAGRALEALAEAGARTWGGTPGGHLVVPVAPESAAGWLLPVLVAAAVAVAVALVRVTGAPAPKSWAGSTPVVAALVAAAVAAPALYPVPAWLPVVALLVAGVCFLARWLHAPAAGSLAVAAGFLSAGVGVAAYDAWLTAGALLVVLVAAASVHLRAAQGEVSAVAGALFAAGLAGSAWTWAALADLDPGWAGMVTLASLAGLALACGHLPAAWWRTGAVGYAHTGVEVGAAAAALPAGLAGLLGAAPAATADWAAAYLTVAGVAACATALLREDRRAVGWAGGALLAAASWVRLWDVGVHTPEAYTLPAAVALAVLGVLHLRRHPRDSTRAALGAALGLGLVPSLLWVWWEPGTLRALLLGLACLGLVLAGLRLRWSAPVVAGAAVGALLVLRHAAPMIGEAVPRWVLIGCAGAALIALGVTWERRLAEARQVLGYVRSLR